MSHCGDKSWENKEVLEPTNAETGAGNYSYLFLGWVDPIAVIIALLTCPKKPRDAGQ